MQVDIINSKGEKTGRTIELPEEIFGVEPNDHVVYLAVKQYLAAQRQGNHKVKTFSCWHHLLCMIFGQLGKRESLSDLALILQSQKSKWYHLGLGTTISKSNLARANENRDWRIYADYAYLLIAKARLISSIKNEFGFRFQHDVREFLTNFLLL